MMIAHAQPLRCLARRRGLLYWLPRTLLALGSLILLYVGIILGYAEFIAQSAGTLPERRSQESGDSVKSVLQPDTAKGSVIGRLEIPRLGVRAALLEGTSWRTLQLGAGHIAGTATPGELGNSGIAGHRDTVFRRLREIHEGDELVLHTAKGVTRYQVDWIQIVSPHDSAVMSASVDSTITLITCYPFHYVGAAPERYVVHAHKK